MKKIFAIFAAIIVMSAPLILLSPVHAAEIGSEIAQEGVTDTVEDNNTVDMQNANTDKNNGTGDTVSQTITDWLSDHLGDITGSSCLVVLLGLIWSIRKKLLPIVSGAIDAVAKRSEDAQGSFKQEITTCRTMLELSGNYLDNCSRSVEKMIEDWKKKNEAQCKAYELQTDLINYLLLNLRIPNELKAEVAERSAEVKAAIQEVLKEE